MTIRGKRYSRFAAFRFGKWDRATGARVLSLIACLRRFFSLIFIPPAPYPSRFARHLPHAGKALVWEKRYSRISDYTDFSRRLRFGMPVEQPLEEGARRRRRIDLPRRGSLLREVMKGDVR